MKIQFMLFFFKNFYIFTELSNRPDWTIWWALSLISQT